MGSSSVFSDGEQEPTAINVLVGQSRVINFDKPIGRFSVSNPEVAEAVLVSPDQAVVNGKTFGQVNFIAWSKEGGAFIVFDVFVRSNLSLIDSQIKVFESSFPDAKIIPHYKPEAECLRDLTSDSTRMIIVNTPPSF